MTARRAWSRPMPNLNLIGAACFALGLTLLAVSLVRRAREHKRGSGR